MIYRLRDLIPDASCGVESQTGQWVRAMHLPFYPGVFGRAKDAIAVLRGKAVAVRWPQHGEFEQAVAMSERGQP